MVKVDPYNSIHLSNPLLLIIFLKSIFDVFFSITPFLFSFSVLLGLFTVLFSLSSSPKFFYLYFLFLLSYFIHLYFIFFVIFIMFPSNWIIFCYSIASSYFQIMFSSFPCRLYFVLMPTFYFGIIPPKGQWFSDAFTWSSERIGIKWCWAAPFVCISHLNFREQLFLWSFYFSHAQKDVQ